MRRVLLVLREPGERVPAAGLFARHGWEVSEAGSVREAKHLLRGRVFDLILVEGHLRDGRGTELLRLPAPESTVRALLGDGNPPPDQLDDAVRLVARPLAEAWVAAVGVAPGATRLRPEAPVLARDGTGEGDPGVPRGWGRLPGRVAPLDPAAWRGPLSWASPPRCSG